MPFIQDIIEQHPDAGYWHQQYPWFSIGQLVNTANKKEDPDFKAAAQKTAVFFNDIPRLHWLLHQPEVQVQAIVAPLHAGETIASEPTRIQTEQTDANTPELPAGTIGIAGQQALPEKESLPVEPIDELTLETHEQADEQEPVEAIIQVSDSDETAVPKQGVASAAEQPEEAEMGNTVSTTLPRLTEPHFSIDLSAEPEDSEMPEEEEPEWDRTAGSKLPEGLLSESLAQAADRFKNEPVDDDTLVFKTAYQHTIDYFASQGIKLEQEPAHDDRFGQQLKTFTSWLRQMKRLPDVTPPEADPVVETHAAHSLQKEEVLTEPMADVLLKQGKKDQAISLLEKLRLLHPQKSHYFAARIDQIKHS